MLTSATWWHALAVLLLRQALQVATPALAAVVAAGGSVDVASVATTLAGALAVTLVAGFWRALRDIDDPSVLGMVVRAAAGVFAGLGVTDWAGLAGVDWMAATVAAVAAALLAVVHLVTDPPAGQR